MKDSRRAGRKEGWLIFVREEERELRKSKKETR